jgi:tetratricopeptide (TPR) repeat protein
MSRGIVRSSRFSPGNLDAESLETLFVGRMRLLDGVLRRLAKAARTKERHFFLLTGPRGSGKTHFVALAYQRLCRSRQYASARARLHIAYLNEEEWGVASYLDFLLRIIQVLLNGSAGESATQEVLAAYKTSYDSAVSLAEETITRIVGNRVLLLICENLNDLFDGLGDDGQKRFRAFIQQYGFWCILATTPALFAGVQSRESPFFGFFTIRRLDRLTFEDALELLQRKAVHEGKAPLASFLRTPIGRARVRAIHHLAGGNHRVYVVLFDFLDHQSLDELVTPFLRMVDDLTPYYQDRMRQLAPRQRKIVEYLARRAGAARVKQIADECLMTEQSAAKQLGELAKASFVNRTERGRESYYELSEPLMRICIEVKDNRTAHLALFVEFLRNWFSARELTSRASAYGKEGLIQKVDSLHFKAAITHYESDHRDYFVESLTEEANHCLQERDFAGLAEVQTRLIQDRGDPRDYEWCAFAMTRSRKAEDAVRVASEGLARYPGDLGLRTELGRAYGDCRRFEDARRELESVIEQEPENTEAICARSDVLWKQEKYDELVASDTRLLKVDPKHSHAFSRLSSAYLAIGDDKAALKMARRAVATMPRTVLAWGTLGEVYWKMGQWESAAKAFKRVLSIDNTVVRAWCKLSTAFLRNGRYQEAVEASKELLARDPQHYHAYLDLAFAHLHLGQIAEAVAAAEGLAAKEDLEWSYLPTAIEVLLACGLAEQALGVLEAAGARGPLTERLDEMRVSALLRVKDYEGAIEAVGSARASSQPSWAYGMEVRIAVARKGIAGARSELGEWVERLAPDARSMVPHVTAMLASEVSSRGPMSAAEGLATIIDVLSPGERDEVVGGALAGLAAAYISNAKLGPEWVAAVEMFAKTCGELPGCQMALAMLRAAAAYGSTGDMRALLELPLEQRELLLDEESGIAGTAFPHPSD